MSAEPIERPEHERLVSIAALRGRKLPRRKGGVIYHGPMANSPDPLTLEIDQLRSENLRLREQITILKGAAHAMGDGVNAFIATWLQVVDATGVPSEDDPDA